jgi:hypothetical protein
MAASGQLLATDLVWKDGMPHWMAASAIGGLFPGSPRTVQGSGRAGTGRTGGIATAISVLCFGIILFTVFLSMAAAVLAVLRVGGTLLAPVVAGVAILFGFLAVGIGTLSPRHRPLIGVAATSFLIGICALLFSIGSVVITQQMNEANEVVAKAAQVEQDRAKAVEARAQAKRDLRKAEELRDQAEEAPKKNAQILKEIEVQRAALKVEEKLVSAQKEALAKKREQDEADFETKRVAHLKEETDLAARKVEIKKLEAALEEKAEKLIVALKASQALKAEADDLNKKAVEERQKAEKKEQEAAEYFKASKDNLEVFLKGLKAKETKDKKAAVDAIKRVGPLPPSADRELRRAARQINQGLCQIALVGSDAKTKTTLRTDSLNALNAVEPELGRAAAFLINLPDADFDEGYLATVRKLSAFGRGCLPLTEASLSSKLGVESKIVLSQAWDLYEANIQVIADVAKGPDDDAALQLLLDAPTTALASRISKFAQEDSIKLHTIVGQQLFEASKQNLRLRKQAKVVNYFVDLLKVVPKSKYPANHALAIERRHIAIEALQSFGPDARNAVDQLMRTVNEDPSDDLREKARAAIKAIQAKGK